MPRIDQVLRKKDVRTESVSAATKRASAKFKWLKEIALDEKLPVSSGNVAILLSDAVNSRGEVTGSLEKLANQAHTGERNLRNILGAMESGGYIERVKRKSRVVVRLRLPGLTFSSEPGEDLSAPAPAKNCRATGKNLPVERQKFAGRSLCEVRSSSISCSMHPTPERDAKAHLVRWDWPEFQRAWASPIEGNREAAEQTFYELALAERTLAIGYISAARDKAASEGRKLGDATDWLVERGWRALLPEISRGQFRVNQRSVAWQVWDALYRVLRGSGLPADNSGGWFVESELPSDFSFPPPITTGTGREPAPASDGATA